MSNVPHELAAEFPEHKDKIHELKISNNHFGRLFDEYHNINREVHRAEAAGLNITDEHYEELKRKRMTLKDELYDMLQNA
ncbi:MAG: hypothetical protein DHS20C08_14050 [Rhodomicrobium sp.]|nr:MAG: hypothetical protein DHS20C08_14050 [Rhodomicrobium sp.]